MTKEAQSPRYQPLQSYALFGGVSDDELPVIESLLKTEHFATGEYLCHQGDPGDRLFLILSGSVEILSESANGELTCLAVRKQGESIGEMTLIDIQNRSASIRALEKVTVRSLSHFDLQQLYESHQQLFILIIMNIAREISRRLRTMNALLCSALYDQKIP
ncbi:cyclic nucleotide-binding domain-containing protein [Motiliproteus sp. MSK22-1]|uniref:cyclic nucleotide-binding domain-containing protein n=1 Tax=Motiliproteus sp. MSK22-1 TaxID=1897630 RepID=UPI0009760D45|nr:cyclic nucleotide-binding domain-containing protein [Motiliproteus sp. MSK22-1]OMH39112.1 hypothetical protein BGP75_05265 [Motiliproteus sp. MSK22-1]